MATPNQDNTPQTHDEVNTDENSNAVKDPDTWATGDEPMTGAQKSYLKTLSDQAGEEFDETLSKADASKRIDDYRKKPDAANKCCASINQTARDFKSRAVWFRVSFARKFKSPQNEARNSQFNGTIFIAKRSLVSMMKNIFFFRSSRRVVRPTRRGYGLQLRAAARAQNRA